MSDGLVLLVSGCFSVLVIVLLVLITWRGRKSSKAKDWDATDLDSSTSRRKPVEGLTRRHVKSSRRTNNEEEDEDDAVQHIEEELGITIQGKLGAKKQAKLEAKIERRAIREAELQERQEKKERQELLEKKQKQEEAKRLELEEEEKERLRLEKEERDRKELQEYLAFKQTFQVQEEGFDEEAVEENGSNRLEQFIKYIEKEKVVLLEDLAAHFNMKTQEVINRLQNLLEQEILVGVMDDRGKFIYIQRQELESVAKFIRQRGRVSLTQLVESSNCLINLTPVTKVK